MNAIAAPTDAVRSSPVSAAPRDEPEARRMSPAPQGTLVVHCRSADPWALVGARDAQTGATT